jgi:hypothetical protein
VYAGAPTVTGSPITFVVLRPNGSAFSVVGVDTRSIPNPLPSTGRVTYMLPAPIAVSGGELLGLYTPGSTAVCYVDGTGIPTTNSLVALVAPATPSPGQTLLVDPPTSPGGYRMLLSANFVPQPAKKCKKRKKKKKS